MGVILQLNKTFYKRWKSLLLGASVGNFGKRGRINGADSKSDTKQKSDVLSEWLKKLCLPLEYHLLLYR